MVLIEMATIPAGGGGGGSTMAHQFSTINGASGAENDGIMYTLGPRRIGDVILSDLITKEQIDDEIMRMRSSFTATVSNPINAISQIVQNIKKSAVIPRNIEKLIEEIGKRSNSLPESVKTYIKAWMALLHRMHMYEDSPRYKNKTLKEQITFLVEKPYDDAAFFVCLLMIWSHFGDVEATLARMRGEDIAFEAAASTVTNSSTVAPQIVAPNVIAAAPEVTVAAAAAPVEIREPKQDELIGYDTIAARRLLVELLASRKKTRQSGTRKIGAMGAAAIGLLMGIAGMTGMAQKVNSRILPNARSASGSASFKVPFETAAATGGDVALQRSGIQFDPALQFYEPQPGLFNSDLMSRMTPGGQLQSTLPFMQGSKSISLLPAGANFQGMPYVAPMNTVGTIGGNTTLQRSGIQFDPALQFYTPQPGLFNANQMTRMTPGGQLQSTLPFMQGSTKPAVSLNISNFNTEQATSGAYMPQIVLSGQPQNSSSGISTPAAGTIRVQGEGGKAIKTNMSQLKFRPGTGWIKKSTNQPVKVYRNSTGSWTYENTNNGLNNLEPGAATNQQLAMATNVATTNAAATNAAANQQLAVATTNASAATENSDAASQQLDLANSNTNESNENDSLKHAGWWVLSAAAGYVIVEVAFYGLTYAANVAVPGTGVAARALKGAVTGVRLRRRAPAGHWSIDALAGAMGAVAGAVYVPGFSGGKRKHRKTNRRNKYRK